MRLGMGIFGGDKTLEFTPGLWKITCSFSGTGISSNSIIAIPQKLFTSSSMPAPFYDLPAKRPARRSLIINGGLMIDDRGLMI